MADYTYPIHSSLCGRLDGRRNKPILTVYLCVRHQGKTHEATILGWKKELSCTSRLFNLPVITSTVTYDDIKFMVSR